MTERWWDDEEEKTTKQTVEDLMNEADKAYPTGGRVERSRAS